MSEAIEIYNGATFRVITDDQNPSQSEIWATQGDLVTAFESSKANISEHIKDILQSGELQEVAVVRKIRTTASDGKTYKVKHYSLDMIIAVGFRVKSEVGIRFRIWANNVIKQYSTKGCVVDVSAMANGYKKSELFALLAEASKRYEEQEQKLLEQNSVIEEQNSVIEEQQSHIEWIDDQRISMSESCARFSPVKDKPCDDAKAVRGHWRSPAKLADGKFNVRRNDKYHAMIRRAIHERSLPDYVLSEFRTVIDADDIKGTKHTKDECTLLGMLNSGHIGVIQTLF